MARILIVSRKREQQCGGRTEQKIMVGIMRPKELESHWEALIISTEWNQVR